MIRRILLAFAVLASAADTAVLGYAAFLFASVYLRGNNPTSPDPLLIPFAILVVFYVGLPIALVSAVAWAGYLAMARKRPRNMTLGPVRERS